MFKNLKESHAVALTSDRRGRQHHGLEPHREEVHDGEVAKGDQEIADSDEEGYFLFQQKRCQHGLDGDFQLND